MIVFGVQSCFTSDAKPSLEIQLIANRRFCPCDELALYYAA